MLATLVGIPGRGDLAQLLAEGRKALVAAPLVAEHLDGHLPLDASRGCARHPGCVRAILRR
jgi:hypothetical protein